MKKVLCKIHRKYLAMRCPKKNGCAQCRRAFAERLLREAKRDLEKLKHELAGVNSRR
jgi:hypothetical protein